MNRRTVIALVVVAVVVLVGVVRTWGPTSPAATPPAPPVTVPATPPSAAVPAEPTAEAEESPEPSSSTPGPGDASPDATPYSQTAEARRLWEPVVVGFGKAFTKTELTKTRDGDAKAWRKALKPFTTVSVQKRLATVDLDNVPKGRYNGYEALKYDEEQLAAQVTYDKGWALVLYVISDGESWRVYRYDRWEE